MGREEMILCTVHLNCLPHMQRHSDIFADHMKCIYMLLMCLTQSHSYVFPFIKTRSGCVDSESRGAGLRFQQWSYEEKKSIQILKKKNLQLYYQIYIVDRTLSFGSPVIFFLSRSSVFAIHLSYVRRSLAFWYAFFISKDLFCMSFILTTVK